MRIRVRAPRIRLGRSGTSLTGRAMILLVTLASIAAALAVPVKVYLGQKSQVAALQAKIRTQEAQVKDLQAQQQAWQSPTYVMTQARERLHYVLPGETNYIVLPVQHPTDARVRVSEPSWYTKLWESVRSSGEVPAG